MGDFICVCTSRIHSLFVLFIYCVIVMFMIMFDVDIFYHKYILMIIYNIIYSILHIPYGYDDDQ